MEMRSATSYHFIPHSRVITLSTFNNGVFQLVVVTALRIKNRPSCSKNSSHFPLEVDPFSWLFFQRRSPRHYLPILNQLVPSCYFLTGCLSGRENANVEFIHVQRIWVAGSGGLSKSHYKHWIQFETFKWTQLYILGHLEPIMTFNRVT